MIYLLRARDNQVRMFAVANEFEKCLELLQLDKEAMEKVRKLIDEAGKEFPCLGCPSKDECANFKWYLKWFGG